MDRELFVRDFASDIETGAIPRTASPEIAEIAESFIGNLETSLHLLSVPRLLILMGAYREQNFGLLLKAMSEDRAYASYFESEETREKVAARIMDLRRQNAEDLDARQFRTNQLNGLIDALLADPEVKPILVALANSVISSLWTAIECLTKDLWVAVLNSRPSPLLQPILASLSSEEGSLGISRRSVSVGLLVKHGFDLRRHLGTVLSPKFDFTSVSGIRVAFMAAFRDDPKIEKILKPEALQALEAARHAVVHRGGRIDAEYLRRTGKDSAIGERLSMPANELTEYARAARDVGAALLQFVDDWLRAVGPPPAQNG